MGTEQTREPGLHAARDGAEVVSILPQLLSTVNSSRGSAIQESRSEAAAPACRAGSRSRYETCHAVCRSRPVRTRARGRPTGRRDTPEALGQASKEEAAVGGDGQQPERNFVTVAQTRIDPLGWVMSHRPLARLYSPSTRTHQKTAAAGRLKEGPPNPCCRGRHGAVDAVMAARDTGWRAVTAPRNRLGLARVYPSGAPAPRRGAGEPVGRGLRSIRPWRTPSPRIRRGRPR